MKTVLLAVALAFVMLAPGLGARELNDRWTVEFSERFRLLSWDNAISLDEEAQAQSSFTRHRTSLLARYRPCPCFEAAVKLTNEFRYYVVPTRRDFDLNEVFFDQLYVKLLSPADLPLILTLGRQDIILGEGFIMFDGNPLDGSRAMYFNAVRLDWTIRPRHKLTALYCTTKETDKMLPRLHDSDMPLIEQPESGLGLYYSGDFTRFLLEGYLIRKIVDSNHAVAVESRITTLGARWKWKARPDLDYQIEAARQFGHRNEANRSAWGLHTYVEFRTPWPTPKFYLPTKLVAGALYLSGDDPATDDWEDWDPMFARWPKWSESYIYAQIKEDGVAYWTDLGSLFGRLQWSFSPSVDLALDFHHLTAPEGWNQGAEYLQGSGNSRGNLVIGKLTFRFDRFWSGHILWEHFVPGSYYSSICDEYNWLRTELMFRF